VSRSQKLVLASVDHEVGEIVATLLRGRTTVRREVTRRAVGHWAVRARTASSSSTSSTSRSPVEREARTVSDAAGHHDSPIELACW
jgi:hypothetical protein